MWTKNADEILASIGASLSERSSFGLRHLWPNHAVRALGWQRSCIHGCMFTAFQIPLSWGELLKRTARETSHDDCVGLAAQLAYYFFLALFPAILFLLSLASFFPLASFIDDVVRALQPIAPADVLGFLEEQLKRLSNADSGGILTIGIVGALWSSSAALVAIIGSLNRAYDIEEGRPWWKVRLTAVGLTVALALLVLISFTLIVAGPTIAEGLASSFGLGAVFEWTWKILQWPIAFLLVSTAVGLVYYFAPDAEQDWAWVTPGAVLGTLLWVIASLAFKFYVSNFADYNASYGAVGGVIVLLLWFYISGLAILVGAEMNAEIEHAAPHGKEPGEKVPGQKKKIGSAAARAYKERLGRRSRIVETPAARARSVAAFQATPSPADSKFGIAVGLPLLAARLWNRLAAAREHHRMMERGAMAVKEDHRTLGEMFAELSRETRTLIQQEVQLAKTELSEKAAKMAKGAGMVVAGGLIAYGGLLAIVAAIVLVLIALGLPPWGSSLLGGVFAGGIGYLLIRSGLAALKRQELTPRKTIETLQENAQWLKAQAR
jgi:membrane protein